MMFSCIVIFGNNSLGRSLLWVIKLYESISGYVLSSKLIEQNFVQVVGDIELELVSNI